MFGEYLTFYINHVTMRQKPKSWGIVSRYVFLQ